MSEFSLIDRYFTKIGGLPSTSLQDDVVIDIGDDAAVVDVSRKDRLTISVDTSIEGVHFPKQTSPYDVGWKSLAVNLSDMAAMGAKPLWATLAITLPKQDESWLAEFSRGFDDLATRFGVRLIGGDTTRGPLSITVNIFGDALANSSDNNSSHSAPSGLLRSGAKPGDKIYVSGFLGNAALGLRSLDTKFPLSSTEEHELRFQLNRPMPRVNEALALKQYINAAIDISDGLYADLQHVLSASGVGAMVNVNNLPISRAYQWCCNGAQSYDIALTGGDDYELCVTVSPENEQLFLNCIDDMRVKGITTEESGINSIESAGAEKIETPWTCIGEINSDSILVLLNANREEYFVNAHAYNHFATENE